MHYLIGFYGNIANAAAYANLPAVPDQSMTISANSKFLFPWNGQVLKTMVQSADLTAAQWNIPSRRNIALPEIYPTIPVSAVGIPTLPAICDYEQIGPRFLMNEEVGINVSRGAVAAVNGVACAWVTDKPTPAPAGEVITLLAAVTSTLIAGAWTNAPLVFNQTLPAGEYSVVGLGAVCNDAAAVRLVFPGGTQYRPGALVDDAYGNLQWYDYFRMGRNGLYGKFKNTAQPTLDILGLVAGAETGAVYLDIIKTG